MIADPSNVFRAITPVRVTWQGLAMTQEHSAFPFQREQKKGRIMGRVAVQADV
jgi:hypothetical protein